MSKFAWLKIFAATLVVFVLGISVLISTENPIIFPTVSLLGSFIVPVTFVIFFYEHRGNSELDMPTLAQSFIFGGILGVLASGLLEPLFISRLDVLTSFLVGLIEEFAKIAALMVVVFRRKHNWPIDGVILGMAVGMGFAAFESIGYAFVAFLQSGGSFSFAVGVTLIRAILSPVGHGLWTAILAGILFCESKNNRFQLSKDVFNAFIGVSLLHGLWDGIPTALSNYVVPGIDYIIGQGLVGLTGIIVLAILWRRFKRGSPSKYFVLK